MIGMSQFILLKELHFLKAINAMFAPSLEKNSRVKGTTAKRDFCRFSPVPQYRGKVTVCPGRVSAYINLLLK